MSFDPRPLTLEGRHVRLEPLAAAHLPALRDAARDPEIFTWWLSRPLGEGTEMDQWFGEAQRGQAAGTDVVFVTVRRGDGRVVGTTRYMDIRRPARALEIGGTWLAKEAQRTPINTEAKYLMLRHAFEALGAGRVQLKTDERNAASRAAILRIGGRFEGILRRYQARYDGFIRNTAMYSLVAEEWPAAKAALEAKLAR